jgi:prevent-host-death family protein
MALNHENEQGIFTASAGVTGTDPPGNASAGPRNRCPCLAESFLQKGGGRWSHCEGSEAKAQLSALIEKVLVGEEVIIGKSGKPVAKLVRYQRSEEQRQPEALKRKIVDDFDDLSEDIAEAIGMKNP